MKRLSIVAVTAGMAILPFMLDSGEPVYAVPSAGSAEPTGQAIGLREMSKQSKECAACHKRERAWACTSSGVAVVTTALTSVAMSATGPNRMMWMP